MVLAGVEGLDDTFKLPARVDSVLAVIAREKRPSLLEDLRTLRSRLSAQPAHYTFPTGQVIVVGEWDLRRWASEALDAVPQINAMVAAVPAMLAGNFAALGQWALGYRLPKPLGLMNLAMDCASYASPDRLARIAREAQSTTLGDAILFPLPDICQTPGLPRLSDAYRQPLKSDHAVLLISGTFDGRTPVQNAAIVASDLPRSKTMVIEGASHGLFREQSVSAAAVLFLRDPR
jgi:pimeloyl-ACP methyl ester carboxylesterase